MIRMFFRKRLPRLIFMFPQRIEAYRTMLNGMRMLLLMGFCCAAGCSWSTDHLVDSSDPAVKIPAMKRTAEQGDQASVELLVRNLQSDDSAVRFYAIQSLHRLTGEDFGYRYYAPDEDRREAVGRWNAWLKAGRPAATSPAAQETP